MYSVCDYPYDKSCCVVFDPVIPTLSFNFIQLFLTLGACARVTVVILCVCVSVTTLALTYDACATKLAYQCILRCMQKVLN